MKSIPVLDRRDKNDILKQIERLAAAYVPNWRLDLSDPDVGAALAMLFAELFQETVDRYNTIPYKHFIAFLNMLNVNRGSAAAASGYVQFEISAPDEQGVEIPGGTQLYAPKPGDEAELLTFETQRSIEAVEAEMTQLFSVIPDVDCIMRLELQQGAEILFLADPKRNEQQHMLFVGAPDVLRLINPAFVEVRLQARYEVDTEELMAQMADPAFASWSYYNGDEWVPFDAAELHTGALRLYKRQGDSIAVRQEDEEGPEGIRCQMIPTEKMSDIVVKGVALRSGQLDEAGVLPDIVYQDDDPIELRIGGYCFGREPVLYDTFYIGSSEALTKRGAVIDLQMDIKTIVQEQMSEEQLYEFRNKYIIDKSEKRTDISEIYISKVVWEYWNGEGWAYLPVQGDENPFSCQSAGKKHVRFICPENFEPIAVNAVENYYIRARVAFVENAFDLIGRRLLPFVEDIRLSFSYDAWRTPRRLAVRNNLRERVIERADTVDWQELVILETLKDEVPTLYVGLDRPIRGYPVSLYMDVEGLPEKGRSLAYEALLPGGFSRIKTVDDTDALSGSGLVSLYIPELLTEQSLFGEDACWLRIQDLSGRYGMRTLQPPRLRQIIWNAADVRQCRTMPLEVHSIPAYEVHHKIQLSETPVQECEIWVDEGGALTPAQKEALLADSVQDARRMAALHDESESFFVQYKRVEDFALCPPEMRCFVLDAAEGVVTFGDDKHGCVPPAGLDHVHITYTTGGGSVGNLPRNAIAGLMSSINYVSNATNFLPTCGGSEVQSMEEVERLGPRRMVHRYRAQSAEDYEALVLERFNEIQDVRCYPNRDSNGLPENGRVTVVVAGEREGDAAYNRKLCGRILSYLHTCCDASVRMADRLQVIPATIMQVNVIVTIELNEYRDVTETERQIVRAIERVIDRPKHDRTCRRIAYIPSAADIYAAVKSVPMVAAAREVMLEGVCFENNTMRMMNLEGKKDLYYFCVMNGNHQIRI